ncbi:MAG: polysaccharide pyruvyl transferase family protein [Anaerolineales bacterium]
MPENIYLINVHSFANAGDAALTLVTIQQLEKNFPGSRFTLQLDDLESYTEPYPTTVSLYRWVRGANVGGEPKWNLLNLLWLLPGTLIPVLTYRGFCRPWWGLTSKALRATLQAYFDADLIVSKPGGFLYSSGLGLTLWIAVYVMMLAIWAGKPLYIYPQSVGPLKYGWEQALIRWLVRHARIFMVREAISCLELEKCGVKPDQVRLTIDTAFDFQVAGDAGEWFKARGFPLDQTPVMGITAIQWSAQSKGFQAQTQYENAIASAARHFIQTYGGKVILFTQAWGPSESQDDRPAARRIAGHLTDLTEHLLLLDEPLSPALLKTLYGRMDVFLGTRMHSNIFALSQEVPVLAIGYYHKTLGIMKMLNLQDWVIEIGQIEESALLARFDQLWANRASLKDLISQKVRRLIQEAAQAGIWVAEDYQRWKHAH